MFMCYGISCKVCVSGVRDADANGSYTHAGVHAGQPTYRLASPSAAFWLFYDGVSWCLMRLECQPDNSWLSLKLFCNELAGFAEGKVPTGRWLDAKGEVLCNIAYEYDEKARVLNSSGDLLRASYLVGGCHMVR